MDIDRDKPHFRTSTTSTSTGGAATSDLLILFSSSMKLTKSILSPGRVARDAASLSCSSRRLQSNGSLKGGASPFFTNSGKKRGSGFENPEPSSPKVTCIGQVRVKTKKKVKRSRSVKRRNGEVSFRDGGGGQKWVHLPVSICEALREFSCLIPCKGSCFSRKGGRWVVAVEGGGDTAAAEEEIRVSRRHVFEDIEVRDGNRVELKGQSVEHESARLSICVPPKNALLLMRCRSDPVKMAALANGAWNAHSAPDDAIEEDENEEEMVQNDHSAPEDAIDEDADFQENEEEMVLSDHSAPEDVIEEDANVEENEEEGFDEGALLEDGDVESNMSSFEELLVQENADTCEDCQAQDEDDEFPICPFPEPDYAIEPPPFQESSNSAQDSSVLEEKHLELEFETTPLENGEDSSTPIDDLEENQLETTTPLENGVDPSTPIEKDPILEENHLETTTPLVNGEDPSTPIAKDPILETKDEENQPKSEEDESSMVCRNQEKQRRKVLPECLLLMMCEPKLSMEVSKETWVCSTDFLRGPPVRPSKPTEEPVKRRPSVDCKPKAGAPPRSSCSLPAAAAAVLVNAVGYDPFVLTRCKSEPMRTAAAKLMPESCFWKNAVRKLEPQRLRAGAPGLRF